MTIINVCACGYVSVDDIPTANAICHIVVAIDKIIIIFFMHIWPYRYKTFFVTRFRRHYIMQKLYTIFFHTILPNTPPSDIYIVQYFVSKNSVLILK